MRDYVIILGWSLIAYAVLFRIFLIAVFNRPVEWKLKAVKAGNGFSRKRPVVEKWLGLSKWSLISGSLILAFVIGLLIKDSSLILPKVLYCLSVFLLIQPCFEILVYRHNDEKRFEKVNTAKEMKAYHDEILSTQGVFGINGTLRSHLRFFMVAIGMGILIYLSFINVLP